MPIFNSRGDYFAGVAGERGSLNGELLPFVTFNGGGFIDDDTLAVPTPNGIMSYQVGHQPQLLDKRTASVIVAGGGRWFGFLADGGKTGVFSNIDVPGTFGTFSRPKASIAGMGTDGTLVIFPVYQQGTNTFETVPPTWGTGYLHTGEEVGEASMRVFGPASAMWTTPGGSVRTLNYPMPVTVGAVGKPKRAFVDGKDWIVYWSDRFGLVAHPWTDPTHAIIIESRPIAFNHDAIGIADVLYVIYSKTQGERPGDIVKRAFVAASATVNLKALAAAVTIDAIPQPCWTGYVYQFSDIYGDNPSAPGSCTIVIEEKSVQRAVADRPVILTLDAGEPYGKALSKLRPDQADKLVAVWIHASKIEDIEQQIPQIRQALKDLGLPPKPIMGYLDSSDWTRMPNPAPDWYSHMAYQRAGEPLAQFETRLKGELAKFPADAKITIFAQSFDTNDSLTADLEPLQYLYPKIAREDSRIMGIFWFSDGRALTDGSRGGTRVHENLRPIHRAIANACKTPAIVGPNEPPVVIPPTSGNPTVTITDYDKDAVEGEGARAFSMITGVATRIQWLYRPLGTSGWKIAADNPASDVDHTYQLGIGRWEIAARVAPGGAQTGAQRIVTVHAKAVEPEPTPEPTPEPEPTPVPVPMPTPTPVPTKKLTWWQKILRALGLK